MSLADRPKIAQFSLQQPATGSLLCQPPPRKSRILLRYGSLRQRAFSRPVTAALRPAEEPVS